MRGWELVEWEILWEIDCWGPERQDLALGQLAAIMDSHRLRSRPQPPIRYMPYVRACQAPSARGGQTVSQMKCVFRTAMHGFTHQA